MNSQAILLISGDAEVERAASEAALKTGQLLTVVHTAREAVKQFMRGFQEHCLILVDLEPDVHGLAFVNALDDCHGKAPLVALTGRKANYMKPLAMGRGADVCLGKPVTAKCFEHLFERLTPIVAK